MPKSSHDNEGETHSTEFLCEPDVIDLSTTQNFFKPHINIDFSNLDNHKYTSSLKLCEKIATTYKINPNQLTLYNNNDSAIFSLFNLLNLKHCTIYSPSSLKYINTTNSYDYINIFTQIDRAVQDNSLVIFENPSLINGMYINLENYLVAWSKINCTILIDESFLDFTNYNSVIKYVNKYDNLYVIKSITKYYASKNVNCTSIISNERNIESLNKSQVKWQMSAYDNAVIQNLLSDLDFNKTAKAININNYLLLEKILKESNIIKKVYKSDVNFILVKLNNITATHLQEHLNHYNILVKDCSAYEFLDDSFVRISVSNEKALLQLKDALDTLRV